jgi:integrase
MAGTVRKRIRTNSKNEARSTWLADYIDQNGKRHNRTFDRKKDADAFLLVARGEVRDGLHTPDVDSITVAEAVKLWLRYCEGEGHERGSLRTYGQYVRLYIEPLLGNRKLSRLTAPLVQAFRDELLTRTSRDRAKAVLTALKSTLADAQRRGLVAQNVASPVKIDRNARDRRPLEIGVDVPTKAEVQAILQCAAGVHRPRLVTLIFTGLRASELRALTWAHIDFDKRQLLVRQRADHPWGKIGAVKSRNGYRDVPLSPLALNTLREWKVACPPSSLGLVFPGRGGDKVIVHTALQMSFDEAQTAAGAVAAAKPGAPSLPKYRLHALRHFFASWGIEQGFSPKRLQELLGHGSIKMTYDVYGHLFPTPEDDHARFAAGELALVGHNGARIPDVSRS